ncbi:hypothetical protein ACOAKC_12390 [Hathewaya histolytica]|uniref:hypothetical protein n=1 Tax=Hathewaya histolytica TaxID=1498 RepID=UPI003B6848EA
MIKKAFIYPILATSLLILLFIGCIWGANLPISSQTSYLLFIITSLFIIISSVIGIIKYINVIVFKKI